MGVASVPHRGMRLENVSNDSLFWKRDTVRKSSREQATKSTGNRGRRDEDTDSEVQLSSLVEGGQIKGNARHGATLEDSQKGSSDAKLVEILDKGGADGDEAKAENQRWNIDSRADVLEQNVGGDFDQEIDYVKDTEGPVESISNQVEVLCHSLDASIANVCTVQEAEEITGKSHLSHCRWTFNRDISVEGGQLRATRATTRRNLQDGDDGDDSTINLSSDQGFVGFCPFNLVGRAFTLLVVIEFQVIKG